MTGTITFFPVGNGDMTLISLPDNTTLLTDCCINENEETTNSCDVLEELRKLLRRDEHNRPYVDVFILSHPDEDHCRGLLREFHLGPLSDYDSNTSKIVIREMWSSPLVFRRRSADHPLCDDAAAWNREAKRRVNLHRARKPRQPAEGDRILILGGDEPGHTEGVEDLVIDTGSTFDRFAGVPNRFARMRLLGPLPPEVFDNPDEINKNDSSVILSYSLNADPNNIDVVRYLTGGDAAVGVWKALSRIYRADTDALKHNLLLAPHHCSWGVLSEESYENGKGKADPEALSAFSHIRPGGFIVSSSKPINSDDADPPCYGAKLLYQNIAKTVGGEFLCTGEEPTEKNPEPLVFFITSGGPQRKIRMRGATLAASGTPLVSTPARHG